MFIPGKGSNMTYLHLYVHAICGYRTCINILFKIPNASYIDNVDFVLRMCRKPKFPSCGHDSRHVDRISEQSTNFRLFSLVVSKLGIQMQGTLWKSMMIHHMNCCCQMWSPAKKCHIKRKRYSIVEKLQEKGVKNAQFELL